MKNWKFWFLRKWRKGWESIFFPNIFVLFLFIRKWILFWLIIEWEHFVWLWENWSKCWKGYHWKYISFMIEYLLLPNLKWNEKSFLSFESHSGHQKGPKLVICWYSFNQYVKPFVICYSFNQYVLELKAICKAF